MSDWIATDRVGPSCRVLLFDLTKSLPQRIEGQYRRHWGLATGIWNLYFREKINLGISLTMKHKVDVAAPQDAKEEDASMAAEALFKKLEHGYYLDKGKRRKMNGDFSKLLFAEHIIPLQRKLLSDFRFRCQAVPSTQEIRNK